MALSEDLHSISRLFGDSVEQLGKLVQNETELAKAELSDKMAQAGRGAAFLVGAAILVIPVLVILLIALALWLTSAFHMSPVAAHLISAVVGAVIAGILASMGMSYLKTENLKPKVTMRQVERDIATAKELAR